MKLLPMILLTVLFSVLGARLVASGNRHGGGYERWLGCFFLGIAMSAPLRGGVAMGLDFGVSPAMVNLLGWAATSGGMLCLVYFVWRVFRPDIMGLAIFNCIAALNVLQLIMFASSGAAGRQSHPVHMFAVSVMLASVLWAFVESFRYWRMMRKRLRLGLGDEVIANRFGLWTMWTGALVSFPIFNLSIRVFAFSTGHTAEGSAISSEFAWAVDVARGMIAVTGPMAAVSTWLIFFPPRLVSRRASPRARRQHLNDTEAGFLATSLLRYRCWPSPGRPAPWATSLRATTTRFHQPSTLLHRAPRRAPTQPTRSSTPCLTVGLGSLGLTALAMPRIAASAAEDEGHRRVPPPWHGRRFAGRRTASNAPCRSSGCRDRGRERRARSRRQFAAQPWLGDRLLLAELARRLGADQARVQLRQRLSGDDRPGCAARHDRAASRTRRGTHRGRGHVGRPGRSLLARPA